MNALSKTTNCQAVERHRKRLGAAGLARFEVKAPVADKELLRRVAKALVADDGVVRERIEAALTLAPTARTKGTVLAMLLSAPRVEEDIFQRIPWEPRKVDL